jgi:hypothetical protein
MPGSEPPRWRRPLLLGAAMLVAALALVAARVVWFDPYWLFRAEPPWLSQDDGSNRLLDRQMRRAKSLQLMTRRFDTVLMGSSTTYHGLDPRDADPGPRLYNAGISGVLADELQTVAAIIASRGQARRVVLGLDYYMFSRSDRTVQLDRRLRSPLGRANALAGAVIGRYAIHDAWESEVGARTDPGRWTRDGFRITPKLEPELTRMNDAIRRRTTVALQPSTYGALHAALDRLRGREVVVYLAPVSPAQRHVLADLGLLDDLARWRENMRDLAARRGVAFHDLADLGGDDDFDPAKGSTDLWLDNLHYTPVIGRQVLEAVGLRTVRQGCQIPEVR